MFVWLLITYFFVFQDLYSQQNMPNNLISLVKGPLEYVSDLELPDEQLVDIIANDSEALQNDVNDASLSNSIIAQDVSTLILESNNDPISISVD